MYSNIGNCDIDFFNFCLRKVQNFEIFNQFKQTDILQSSFKSTESKTEIL
jgi:hypothetical protein